MTATKIAIVIQRYGNEVVGGAESHMQQVAERLHHDLGYAVDVYTTTAKDYRTWAPAFAAGSTKINGVSVHRFDCQWQRFRYFKYFNRLTAPLIHACQRLPPLHWLALRLEWLWIVLQGPYCPTLLRTLETRQAEYQKIIFVTYLYYPTLAGMALFKNKSILIPLAHDEYPFYFLIVAKMLRSAGSILNNTSPEATLLRGRLNGQAVPMENAGLGFDGAQFSPTPKAAGSAPYLLYLGRISEGKGVAQLLRYFVAMKTRHPSDLELHLAGHLEADVHIPKRDDIKLHGFVDEAQKISLIRNALALVNPSPRESLSMIVIEAFALQVPVLVSTKCDVLRYYTEEVSTARGFSNKETFIGGCQAIMQTDWYSTAASGQLQKGREWALANFSWTKVLAIYQRHLDA